MRNQLMNATSTFERYFPLVNAFPAADLSKVSELTEAEREEVLAFLAVRPVHTVVMTSFVNDNGLQSKLNRGKFYGCRDGAGRLEGVALIGHSTLIEARSEAALMAFAQQAKNSETPIHLIMSHGTAADSFWNYYSAGLSEPRLRCVERLFEVRFPFMVRKGGRTVRLATTDELLPVAEAQAAVALMECGIDPMHRDREGFLKRVLRRIEQGRVFVFFDGDELVFKVDVIAETGETAYLEGVFVTEKYRGKGIGSDCLASVTLGLLDRVRNVCLLSNVEFEPAHKTFARAGFQASNECTTLFV
jgi:uncharacterized protein